MLTSVDVEAEHQRLARTTFTEDGIPSQRFRLICGRALEVLPRLADAAYDLVFCDGDKSEYGEYLTEALRLLRPGGVVALDNALWNNRVADPAQRDPDTVAIREVGRRVLEDERLVPVLLPVGDGLLLAAKRCPMTTFRWRSGADPWRMRRVMAQARRVTARGRISEA